MKRDEEVIIAQAGEPVARLVPSQPEAGRLWIAEDLDAPSATSSCGISRVAER